MITNIQELNQKYDSIKNLSIGGNINYLMSIVSYSDDMLIEANNRGYINWEVYLNTFIVDPITFEDILASNPDMVDVYKISKDKITTMKNPWLKRENWSDSLALMIRLIKGEEK
jgi:hypothetical protein